MKLSVCYIGTRQDALVEYPSLTGTPSRERYIVHDATVTSVADGLVRVRGQLQRWRRGESFIDWNNPEDHSKFPEDWPWVTSERPWYDLDRYRKGRFHLHPKMGWLQIPPCEIDVVVPVCEVSGIPAPDVEC